MFYYIKQFLLRIFPLEPDCPIKTNKNQIKTLKINKYKYYLHEWQSQEP